MARWIICARAADVVKDRIGLHGWSNGGGAALAAMAMRCAATPRPTGFRAALAFYADCGLHGRFDEQAAQALCADALAFHGTADEETSSKRCARLVERSRAAGGPIEMVLYPGATHGFDAPDARRQAVDANIPAAKDATARALDFFARHIRQ